MNKGTATMYLNINLYNAKYQSNETTILQLLENNLYTKINLFCTKRFNLNAANFKNHSLIPLYQYQK